MITAKSRCDPLVQDHALPRVRDIVGAKVLRDTPQHRLLWNIEHRQVFSIANISTRLASSDKCYKAFIRVCRELSHKVDFLALVFFTSTTLY